VRLSKAAAVSKSREMVDCRWELGGFPLGWYKSWRKLIEGKDGSLMLSCGRSPLSAPFKEPPYYESPPKFKSSLRYNSVQQGSGPCSDGLVSRVKSRINFTWSNPKPVTDRVGRIRSRAKTIISKLCIVEEAGIKWKQE
jgi:hypothetical protein